ncbi:MAG: FHA domain-containing protein [Pyrinomonadaceae bacterium]
MFEVNLSIQTPQSKFSATLVEKLSVGRTNIADLVLDDASLSRLHATFERHGVDGDEIWVFDDDSMNGTFVNGEQVSPNGIRLNNGTEIWLGNSTRIVVEVQNSRSKVSSQAETKIPKANKPKGEIRKQKPKTPPVLIIAGTAILAILLLAIGGIFVARSFEDNKNTKGQKSPQPQSSDIPIAVVDPLKGDPDDLDEIFEAFEVQEDMNAENIDDVKSTVKETTNPSDPNESISLNVTRAFWEEQKAKALAARSSGATGISPPGLNVPPELRGDGVIKQKQKLAELINVLHYQQPMDFGDLAQKRLNKELIELPMATTSFYLEVGSSASEDEFTAFNFDTGNTQIAPNSPKFEALKKLAENFAGQKYDLNNGRDRKQMRIRLLRMFHPRALPILKELGDAYLKQFNRPLRVTSLTRSMDYQIALNKTNPNSFKVKGAGSLPPHTSGCAFDLGRKHMSVEEQNFVMKKLAEMEERGILDALIEFNVNACFHTFIYPDGKPPGK